ncbi:MAG: hypothetical protein KAJ19_17730, partial [Gammaproteobacteria bacterium]|nr:hypothetical protein [Gammaproteobacteria bacterium]
MEYTDIEEDSAEKNIVKLVFCLSIDLIGSTNAGLKLTTQKLDRFNISLINQIQPHLKKLGLTDALLKFTGDGWLVMTDEPKKAPALCCLATIMAEKFQEEMSLKTGLAIENIPSLRIAICLGRDISVEMPDGQKDWVGDSARRATRASGYCLPNKIIIDEPVRYNVFRDFNIKSIDFKQHSPEYQPTKMEEELILYYLGELKTEAIKSAETPEYFVYTLGIIGKIEEAAKVAQQISKRLENEAIKANMNKEEASSRTLQALNRVVASLPDYSTAFKTLENIRKAGIKLDLTLYNTLINKASDYETTKFLVNSMIIEGIQPDKITYNKLINKSPDYENAKVWKDKSHKEGIQLDIFTYNRIINKTPDYETAIAVIDEMHGEDILPDVVTYNTLIKKAPDFETIKPWMDRMRKEGILPDVVTYNTLINKAPDYETTKIWKDRMREEGILPDVVTYNTLINKAHDYETCKVWIDRMRE